MPDVMPDFGPPDWGLTHTSKKEVTETAFGDGYRLRRPNGINHNRRVWGALSWANLDETGAQALYTFLDERALLTPFDWVMPSGETVRVICSQPSMTQLEYNHTMITVEFMEDFNP